VYIYVYIRSIYVGNVKLDLGLVLLHKRDSSRIPRGIRKAPTRPHKKNEEQMTGFDPVDEGGA